MMTAVHRPLGGLTSNTADADRRITAMFLLEFVNRVRWAQSCEPLEELPAGGADGSTPLELAMGCRLETDRMRLSSPQAAAAVADATGLPVGLDRMTVALPRALVPLADEIEQGRRPPEARVSSAR
jgi:hypothetical protein